MINGTYASRSPSNRLIIDHETVRCTTLCRIVLARARINQAEGLLSYNHEMNVHQPSARGSVTQFRLLRPPQSLQAVRENKSGVYLYGYRAINVS